MHIEFRYAFPIDYSTVHVFFYLVMATKGAEQQSHRAEQRQSGKDEPQMHSTFNCISVKNDNWAGQISVYSKSIPNENEVLLIRRPN